MVLITACLIAGWFWFKRKTPFNPLPGYFSSASSSTPGFEFISNSTRTAKPLIVVAPIENQSPKSSSRDVPIHPERIRSAVEDTFSSMQAVELVRPPPAQLRQPVAADMIVFVTLLDMHDEAATFNGYGINAKTFATKCSLRLHVIRAADKTSLFSTVLDGTHTDVRTAVANAPLSGDRKLGAIRDALKGLAENPEFQSAVSAAISR
jgi:hypothetical protein